MTTTGSIGIGSDVIIRHKYVRQVKRGWQVSVPGCTIRLFRPDLYGGDEAAAAAAAFHAQVLASGQRPPAERPPRKGNPSGVAGVRRKLIRGKPHWVAEWNDRPGHTVYRSFSIGRYGDEAAKLMAIAARKQRA
jgi:hypothetical protein